MRMVREAVLRLAISNRPDEGRTEERSAFNGDTHAANQTHLPCFARLADDAREVRNVTANVVGDALVFHRVNPRPGYRSPAVR